MLYTLLKDEAEKVWLNIVLAGALSGIANAAVIELVNQGAKTATQPRAGYFFAFLAACVTYVICLRYCIKSIFDLLETALYKLRVRVADKIRRTELQSLEQIGTAEIYERLAQETATISQTSPALAGIAQSISLLIFLTLYLFYLSVPVFLLAIAVFLGGWWHRGTNRERSVALMQQAVAVQVRLFERLIDLLHGFKELRLHTRRSDDLYKDYSKEAARLRRDLVHANVIIDNNYISFKVNLFFFLCALVFILPQFIELRSQGIHSILAVVLFGIGSLSALFWALPQYDRANLAAKNIYQLEQKLEQALKKSNAGEQDPWRGRFQELRADNIEYRYPVVGQTPFAIGPLSLSVRAGEIVFIVGGNGSGKSTLIKVLTGLYQPNAGNLYVNDIRINMHNIQGYREMIAAVFSDFHLFKKLYGFPEIREDEVERLLKQLQIAHKTSLSGGSLSTLDLSTGQRKRLAMVIALLENRPLYVFDEWAADQDAEFRRYYYEELLQDLKRRGKAVIAISHDTRYFHCADRVLQMEDGLIRSETSPPAK